MLLSQLDDAHVDIYYILQCEPFRNDDNPHLFKLLSYNLIYKKGKLNKDGVAIHVRDNIQCNLREELSVIVEGVLESILY